MEKKYKLTDETIRVNRTNLYRIEALRNFSNVYKGDKGGFVESEDNLSHDGDCWIYDDAIVYGNARVSGNARVFSKARIFNNARVSDNARVYGEADIFCNAEVYGNAQVGGRAIICDRAKLYENAKIFNNAKVYGNAKIYGSAKLYSTAEVSGNAQVCGYTELCGIAIIKGNAKIKSDSDYIIFKNWWSSGRFFIWTRSNNKWLVGCFYGTGKELIEKAYKDSELSGREYERVVNYAESILQEKRVKKPSKIVKYFRRFCIYRLLQKRQRR